MSDRIDTFKQSSMANFRTLMKDLALFNSLLSSFFLFFFWPNVMNTIGILYRPHISADVHAMCMTQNINSRSVQVSPLQLVLVLDRSFQSTTLFFKRSLFGIGLQVLIILETCSYCQSCLTIDFLGFFFCFFGGNYRGSLINLGNPYFFYSWDDQL